MARDAQQGHCIDLLALLQPGRGAWLSAKLALWIGSASSVLK